MKSGIWWAFSASVLILALSSTAVVAETDSDVGADRQSPSTERLFLGRYSQRIRIDLGLGYTKLFQPILSEAGPSWMMNSALRSGSDPTRPIALPFGDPAHNRTTPLTWGAEYSWKDRVDVSYQRKVTRQDFGRYSGSSQNFFQPETSLYTWSVFEGLRVMKYGLDQTQMEIAYYQPITAKLRIGPLIQREIYDETDTISLGSYMLRNQSASTNPGLRVWSLMGNASLAYRFRGWLPGVGLKWYALPWLQVNYRFHSISRKGDFDLSGPQLMQSRDASGNEGFLVVMPAFAGSASEKGSRHQLEAVFSKCRFSLAVGIWKEDVTRTYSSYFGQTLGVVQDVSLKSEGIGTGERSSSFAGHALELYVRLGTSLHF